MEGEGGPEVGEDGPLTPQLLRRGGAAARGERLAASVRWVGRRRAVASGKMGGVRCQAMRPGRRM